MRNWVGSRLGFLLNRSCQIYNFNFHGPRLGLARVEGKVAHISGVLSFLRTTSYQRTLHHKTSPTGHLRIHHTVRSSNYFLYLCCGVPLTVAALECASRVGLGTLRYDMACAFNGSLLGLGLTSRTTETRNLSFKSLCI